MRQRVVAAAVCAGLLLAPAAGSAQSVWFDLTVPGSLEEMLGTADRSLEGSHLLRSLIGAFHDPTGTIVNPAQAARAFRDCLGDVQRLRDRWRAVERAAGGVSLPAAAAADGGRRPLEAFLDVFDLQITGSGADRRVGPNRAEARRRQGGGGDGPGAPAVCGVGRGWGSAEIERRLNAGETIAWDLPHFEVSLPLSPRVWLQVLYGEDPGAGAAERAAERAADLVGRLVTNPRAAQFYAGLAALDDPTLTWLQTSPRVLADLAGDQLTTFAQFGGGLRVRDGAVRAPGGAAANAFLEALVGVPVTEPERFVNRLFSSERAAAAFDLVSRLPAPPRRFVTGAGRPDPRDWRRGLTLLGRVIETLPLPDPRFAEPAGGRDPDLVFTPRPGLRHGDRLNENICNLPDDEATALTWFDGGWYACGPIQCYGVTAVDLRKVFPGEIAEFSALDMVHSSRRGTPLYVCRVELADPLSGHSIGVVANLYRLGYPLAGQDLDSRRYIMRLRIPDGR